MNFVLKHEGYEEYLEVRRPLNRGVQYLFKFENGYGASVVKHSFSYGKQDDLWELAVISYDGSGDWVLNYDTEITDDVIGWLTDENVIDLLQQIKEL